MSHTAPVSISHLVYRTCACDCGRQFVPSPKRPGQVYIWGHKPKNAKAPPPPKPQAVVAAKERSRLDYRIALQTAERDQLRLADEIDAIDNAIAAARVNIRLLDVNKENATARHLTVTAAIECLKALATDGIVDVLLAKE